MPISSMTEEADGSLSPPPQRPFWTVPPFFVNRRRGDRVAVSLYLESPRRTFYHPSPVNSKVKYPESMVCQQVYA